VTQPSAALREQLAELIAIPSVSADMAHADEIVAAAEWVAAHIRSTGGTAELVPWGLRPLVIGEVAASERPETAPTILCYAHFDVQPPDPLDLWESPPFELTQRDGRLYARGVADDKGNLFVLVEAVRQLAAEGALPVNVRFAFDGEEEIGGDSVVEWVDADEGRADAALILDGAMIRRGQPGFMVGVRGMVYLHLRVRTGATDMHSGMFGAAALNATHALMAALAPVLPDAEGRLPDELRQGRTPPSEEELAAWAALPSGAEQLAQQGADRAGRRRRVLRPHLRRHLARRERDRERLARPRQDRASGRGTRERVPPARARPGSRDDPGRLRAARARGAPGRGRARHRGAQQRPSGTDGDGLGRHPPRRRRLRADRGGASGARPFRRHAPNLREPTFATGFGIESECNVHAPNENVPEDALDVGVATMREVFTRLGGLRG
jgi:acetylornithine deacetylase/succinyl-diaminopimelate desuccinylase-like protein